MTTRKEATLEAAEMAGIKKEYVVMSKFSPVPFAEELIKNNHFIYDKNKILWRFSKESGLWEYNAEQFIKTTLRSNLMGDEQQKKHYVEEIVAYIKDLKYNGEFEMDSSPYLIPLKNKVYNLRTGKFVDFDPEFYLSNKLERDIDDEIKECPLIDKFFSECVSEKYKDMLYETIAYSLFKDIPYQKLFFIYGPASTGKSIFMSLFEKFLGQDNYCSVEPKQIQKDKHSTSQMEYKYANIVSDINYDEFENITQVKKLSGGDTVTIRKMYKDPYNRKLFTKQIYSTNKLPVVKEKTKAWYRRVYLIEFANIINSKKRDLFLLNKLTTEKELKGLTYKCLEKLQELYKRNFIFSWDMDEEKMRDIYEELSNPILMFIRDNAVEERDTFMFKWEFSERLNNWLKNNHFPNSAKSEVNKYMRDKYNESNRPSSNGNKTYRVWTGLHWKERGETSLNHFNHFNQKIKQIYIYRGVLSPPLFPLNPLNESNLKGKSDTNA